MSHHQLSLGQKFRAEISKVNEHGLIVKLSPFLTAEVPLQHLTNVPLKSVPEKFKEGVRRFCVVFGVRYYRLH